MTFNAKKTECTRFGKNACPLQRQVNVNGQRIKWKDNVKYLGNILTKDMCDDADIRAKRGEFTGSVNRLNVQFRVVPDQIRIRLLQTYCTAWYGCQTWLLNTNHVKGMNIEWKKAVRRTLNLPSMTRSKLIPLLAGNCSFQEQHERRCGALYASMMQSDNMLAYYMARRPISNVLGQISTPLAHVFNMSLQEGIVPLEWKETNIIPLFKKGPRNKFVNYRPVSLTSVIC